MSKFLIFMSLAMIWVAIWTLHVATSHGCGWHRLYEAGLRSLPPRPSTDLCYFRCKKIIEGSIFRGLALVSWITLKRVEMFRLLGSYATFCLNYLPEESHGMGKTLGLKLNWLAEESHGMGKPLGLKLNWRLKIVFISRINWFIWKKKSNRSKYLLLVL